MEQDEPNIYYPHNHLRECGITKLNTEVLKDLTTLRAPIEHLEGYIIKGAWNEKLWEHRVKLWAHDCI